jgi:hypothetical protein
MPTQMRWMVEKRIIWVEVTGKGDDIDSGMQSPEAKAYWDQGIPLVHLLMDMRGLEGMPPIKRSNAQVEEQKKFMEFVKQKAGWTLVLTENALVRFSSTIFASLFNSRQRFFGTMEDALDFLQEQDETLPNLKKHNLPAP